MSYNSIYSPFCNLSSVLDEKVWQANDEGEATHATRSYLGLGSVRFPKTKVAKDEADARKQAIELAREKIKKLQERISEHAKWLAEQDKPKVGQRVRLLCSVEPLVGNDRVAVNSIGTVVEMDPGDNHLPYLVKFVSKHAWVSGDEIEKVR